MHFFSCNPARQFLKSVITFSRSSTVRKLLRMKLITVLLMVCCLHLSAETGAQTVTLDLDDAPLGKIFEEIQKQTDFNFFFDDMFLSTAKKVTIKVKNASLRSVLEACFKDQPFSFQIFDRYIAYKEKTTTSSFDPGNLGTRFIAIRGKVIDQNGDVIVGATVSVKNTDIAISTNEKGDYELISIEENAILVLSGVNIETVEVAVKGRVIINFTATIKFTELDRPIVVAYNTTTAAKNVSSLTVVKGEEIQTLPNRSFEKSLQGMVPGLLITNGSGEPGGGVSNFVLRGIATAASVENGSVARNPLIVIDGVPVTQEPGQIYKQGITSPIGNPLSQINPSDIESISILKDAAAVALYGSRASNGVILLTTKKGKAGKTVFSFRHQSDLSTRIKGNRELLNRDQYFELLFEAYRNFDSVKYASDQSIINDLTKPNGMVPARFATRQDGSFYPSPNWDDEFYISNAITNSDELSMSGGNEKYTFYLNLEYLNQDGIVKGTGFDRKSVRLNFENKPASWIKIGMNTTISHTEQRYSGPSRGGTLFGFTQAVSPLNPIYLEDDEYLLTYRWGVNGTIQSNPSAAMEYNISKNTNFRGLSKLYGELNIVRNFKFTSSLGLDYGQTASKEKDDPRLVDITGAVGVGRIEQLEYRNVGIITTNVFSFNKMLNQTQSINIVAGQEAQIITQNTMAVAVKDLKLPYYDQISSPGVNISRREGDSNKETLQSLFAQGSYSYQQKYSLLASIRRDGSSRFGPEKRYGTYWSTGIGWTLSEESFVKNNIGAINFLKLRGSIGAAGNAGGINATTRYDQLTNSTYYGNIAVFGLSSPGNPEVKWEKTFTWDAGLEVKLFKDRISMTADIYSRKTTDLLYLVNLPQSSGYVDVLSNIGEIKNSGVEIAISTDVIKTRNFTWNISGNWSRNKNKLVKANIPLVSAVSGGYLANKEGENFSSFYMPIWAGVDPANGNSQWIDSAGKATSIYSKAKNEFVGKPQPDAFGGLSSNVRLRNFDLSIMFYYQYGFKIYDQGLSSALLNDGSNAYLNQTVDALDRWKKSGDIAKNPKRVLNNNFTRTSTRFLFDGDYIRLQNVRLAYTLGRSKLEKLNFNQIKVFVQSNNLYTWTKYSGNDPGEANAVGTTQFSYPTQLSLTFGANLSF